jgi:hypothetical protein
MKVSNSDFWILAAIFSTIGGIGVYEGNELHPAFYTQPAIIFGSMGYFAYKTFYADRKQTKNETADSSPERSHSG